MTNYSETSIKLFVLIPSLNNCNQKQEKLQEHLSERNKKVNTKSIYGLFVDAFLSSDDFVCPCCLSKSNNRIDLFNIHGYYERNLVIDKLPLLNSIIKFDDCENIVDVMRVKCKECKHTHAILPYFIAPFKTHALPLILESLIDYYNNVNIVDSVSSLFTGDQMEVVVKTFEQQLPLICSTLKLDFFDFKTDTDNKKKIEIINMIVEYGIQEFLIVFAKETHKVLMCSRNLLKLHQPKIHTTPPKKILIPNVKLFYMKINLF